MDFFECFKKIVTETFQDTTHSIFVIKPIYMTVKCKANKNKRIIVGLWTIAVNLPIQVYLVVIEIRTILRTHRSVIGCRKAISNN